MYSEPDKPASLFLVVLLACLAASSVAAGAETPFTEPVRPGVLEPRMRVTLSSEFALPVVRVAPRPGDSFAKGDILVEFDSVQARANLAAAVAAEKAALANLQGMEELVQTRHVTAVEVAMAAQKHDEAIARRVSAARELEATVLAAPFSGRVAERHINDHEWAARGAPLLTLVDDTTLEVRFVLSESLFGVVRPGLPVSVRVPATGTAAAGTVSRTGAVFDAASRTFDVWAELDNADNLYRAGMAAKVTLPPVAERP